MTPAPVAIGCKQTDVGLSNVLGNDLGSRSDSLVRTSYATVSPRV
jgi:hypothetical protein